MRGVQIFCCALFLGGVAAGEPTPSPHPHTFQVTDVDQHQLSTGDGQVTVIVAVSTSEAEKARMVGDRSPDFCLGNPEYRFITLIRFAQSHNAAARAIIRAAIRHRLNEEARTLQLRYKGRGVTRNARDDVFAVADFDGTIATQLGLPGNSTDFAVLVIGRKGEIHRRWNELPTADELRAALK